MCNFDSPADVADVVTKTRCLSITMSTIGACDIGTIQLELAVEVSLSSFYAVSQILCAVGEVRTLQSFHDDIKVNAMQSEQCFKWKERKTKTTFIAFRYSQRRDCVSMQKTVR